MAGELNDCKNCFHYDTCGYRFPEAECQDFINKKTVDEALQEKLGNDKVNEWLKDEYDCNCTQLQIIQMYIDHLTAAEESKTLKGFRILTNEDKENYEQWLKKKLEREKGCEYCRNPRKQWTYIEKSDKYCKNCGRDLRQSKGKN